MKIALMGPISTAGITSFLSEPPPRDFPPGVGGAPFMASLIGALLDSGHEVCAITCGGHWAGRDTRPLSLKGERFEFHCAPVRKHSMRPHNGRIGRILDLFGYERRLLGDILAQAKPDFVHAHWTYEYAMAAIDSGYPYLVTAHDDPVAVLKHFRNAYRLGRYLMARSVLRRARAISAVSGYLREQLESHTRTPINVIPNPLDRRFLEAASGPRPAPSSLPEVRLVSVINGWGDLKNPQSSLLAFAEIRKAFPKATYHLFGHDFQPDGIAQQWAMTRGIADGVMFHGPVPHIRLLDELKLATLMLHPSRMESCPMGIAEAMAVGLPVVGGMNSGGVAWMIDGGGLTVDINKPQAIAEAALRLISDDDLYEGCSALALERVKQFAPAVVASQYLGLYEKARDRDERLARVHVREEP